ncbi:MAG: TlyA family RNA methyltransferase [Magnetococcales bacterium]|nr:TlyA family RNA methyltransferase [Magnetococcales bacterium]
MSKPRTPRQRLDQLLTHRGLAESIDKARRIIMTGKVLVNDTPVDKPGTQVAQSSALRIKGKQHRWVSRGGLKLVHALNHWQINPTGQNCLDIGASTGGFTDVLLQHGADRVFAVDVGYGILDWRLQQDPRVVNLERTNVRNLTKDQLDHTPIQFFTIDVSFIGLSRVLPFTLPLIEPGGTGIVLLKPQFELPKKLIPEGGIVRDPSHHELAFEKIQQLEKESTFTIIDRVKSSITGTQGNIEELLHIRVD